MKTFTLLALAVFASQSFAATIPLRYTCESGEDTVKINLGEFRNLQNAYVEVYNQGGMGPDHLEYSTVAIEQTPVYAAGQLVQIDMALPMGGELLLDIAHDLKKAIGTFKATNRAIKASIICTLDPVGL